MTLSETLAIVFGVWGGLALTMGLYNRQKAAEEGMLDALCGIDRDGINQFLAAKLTVHRNDYMFVTATIFLVLAFFAVVTLCASVQFETDRIFQLKFPWGSIAAVSAITLSAGFMLLFMNSTFRSVRALGQALLEQPDWMAPWRKISFSAPVVSEASLD